MDSGLRSTKALEAKINKLKDELLRHYSELLQLVGNKNPSRNTTAIMQYQVQFHTAGIIRAGEEFQLLIRQMQEMWLFGQLNTVGGSEIQQQTDENAKVVGELLGKVMDMQQGSGAEAVEGANGVVQPQQSP